MKKNQFVWSLILLLFICFNSCKKNEAVPDPVITAVYPNSALVGASVAIDGSNFSTTASANLVKFNGVDAIVTEAARDYLHATVPVGTTTGKITVEVNGKTATSPSDFTILDLSISSFSPTSAKEGASVVISGNNFEPYTGSNVVKFNGITATVTAATTTSLTVTVPSGATTGKISVSVEGAVATSATDFTVIVPAITDFTPHSGAEGTTVTISGVGFGQLPTDNIVKFNGTPAIVWAVNIVDGWLQVIVPSGATTGKITVIANGRTLTSATDFQILYPTITSFSPSIGSAGGWVVITGTNFGDAKAYDIVKFNGIAATVIDATPTQIRAAVPAGATTGKISVNSATSTGDFTICNGIELLLSDVEIVSIAANRTSFNYSYHLANVGGSAAALTYANSTVQSYVSTDAVYDGSDLPAGGYGLSITLDPIHVLYGGSTSNTGAATVDDHPYLILKFSTTLTECDNTISHTVIKRIIP